MDKFDEYKYFGNRALSQSQRRQNSSQIYLAVNTAIFGVLALLIKDSGLHAWNLVLASLPLFIVGFLACIFWISIISRYKRLIGWYYEQLREMEKEIKGGYKFFTKEWNEFSNPKNKKNPSSFSNLEASMPKLFLGLYIAYGIGMVTAVLFGLI